MLDLAGRARLAPFPFGFHPAAHAGIRRGGAAAAPAHGQRDRLIRRRVSDNADDLVVSRRLDVLTTYIHGFLLKYPRSSLVFREIDGARQFTNCDSRCGSSGHR